MEKNHLISQSYVYSHISIFYHFMTIIIDFRVFLWIFRETWKRKGITAIHPHIFYSAFFLNFFPHRPSFNILPVMHSSFLINGSVKYQHSMRIVFSEWRVPIFLRFSASIFVHYPFAHIQQPPTWKWHPFIIFSFHISLEENNLSHVIMFIKFFFRFSVSLEMKIILHKQILSQHRMVIGCNIKIYKSLSFEDLIFLSSLHFFLFILLITFLWTFSLKHNVRLYL